MSLFERVIMDCRDALQALRDEFKNENFRLRRMSGGEETFSQAQLLHSYLNFIRLSKTAERYLFMIHNLRASADESGDVKKTGKPQDFVRLYDGVLQNLTEIEILPGVEYDDIFMQKISARLSYYKAFRCYYIAESFVQLAKWEEVRALSDRALEYCQAAQSALAKASGSPATNDHVANDISQDDLDKLYQKLNVMKYTAYANCIDQAEELGTPSRDETKVLELNLNEYRRINPQDIAKGKCPPLVRLPPDFKPIPVKPLFYDLALNHVQFPSLQNKVGLSQQQAQNQAGEEAAGGITGFVKGWFWGKK